jgi:galactose mutarotase-like enzyme
VLPDNGGRVASIRSRKTGSEFLLPGSNYEAKAQYPDDTAFEQSDCAGIDECLPTVSLSSSESAFGNAPDHGDLWRHAWQVLNKAEKEVVWATECFSSPLAFTRRLRVHASTLQLEYRIRNLAWHPVPFLYAFHPLFAVEHGDRLILPPEVDRLRVHYSLGDRIGHAGEWINWPVVNHCDKQIALDKAGKVSDGTADMLYTDRLERGIFALYRAQHQQALVMRFDTALLPYLGIWLCNGGWPEDQTSRKQYAIAIEPTVAPHGSLAQAIAAKAAPVLEPGSDFSFALHMEVLGCDRPWSFDEVTRYLNEARTTSLRSFRPPHGVLSGD